MNTPGIWRSPSTVEPRPEACPQTGMEAQFEWQIENFFMCPQRKGEFLCSTSFTVDSLDQGEFRLVLYPRGELEDEIENITCFLECVVEPDYNISVTVSVVGSTSYPIVAKNKACFIIRNGQRQGFVLLPDRKDLEARRSAFLPGEVFTIRCVVSPQYRAPFVCDEDYQSLSEDFLDCMNDKSNFSDFSIFCKSGKIFGVHKVILAIRGRDLAETFGALGDGPLKHSTETNISASALEVILAYLYSGCLKDRIVPDVLNEVYEVAKENRLDDLRRDIFPVETSTVASTTIRYDHRTVSWALKEFHDRVNTGVWPVKTFVDMTIGRFIISFSLLERDGVVFTRIGIDGIAVFVESSVLLRCKVLVDHGENGVKPQLCSIEHWFDSASSDNTCFMDGDHELLYAWKSLKQYPEKLSLVFSFAVSGIKTCSDCRTVDVTNWLESPNPSNRSLQRLSCDMDIVFRDTIEENENDSDSEPEFWTFSDLWIKTKLGKVLYSHRFILAARSERFRSLILKNCSIGKTTVIEVLDVSDETLKDMLRYMYSGKVIDGDLARISDLYSAAKSYKVPALEKRCASLMKEKITPSDIYNLMALAGDHKDENLLAILVDYICMHRTATLNSAEWQKLVSERPLLASRALSDISSKLGQTLYK